MTPDSLGAAIEVTLRDPGAVDIVERQRPFLPSPVQMSLTAPVLIFQTLATLTTTERLVWLVWIWGITLGVVIIGPDVPARRGQQ